MKERFVIQSDNQGIVSAEEFVSSFCDEMHITNYLATISIAVSKAVYNAVWYGNAGDANKQVVIECGSCKGGVFFSVKDEGLGFNFNDYGNFPDEEGRGDGIYMMKILSDRMMYFDGGSMVRLEFDVAGLNQAESIARCSKLSRFYERHVVKV